MFALITIFSIFTTPSFAEKIAEIKMANFNMLVGWNQKWNCGIEHKKSYLNSLSDFWNARKTRLVSVFRFHEFDIVGSQELNFEQVDELSSMMPEYGIVGVPEKKLTHISQYPDLSKDKATAAVLCSILNNVIFYKLEKFELLQNGKFSLSKNPEDFNPLTARGWDKDEGEYRTCIWAKFKDKKNGVEFYVFNTHYQYKSSAEMEKSSILVLKKIEDITSGKSPVIFCGDFNCEITDESLAAILKSEKFNEAYLSSKLPPHGPYNSNPNECNRTRIDHIFVSKDIEVEKFGTLSDHITTNEKKGGYFVGQHRYPSDHYPIVAKLKIKSE